MSNLTDSVIASTASKATYTGAGASVMGWLVSSEAAVFFGIVIGVLGLVVNVIFSIRRDRREQREHEQRMRHDV